MARRKRLQTPEEIRAYLLGCSGEAVEVLMGLMKDTELKPEVRMKVAEAILDRAFGKGMAADTGGDTPSTLRFEGVLDDWSR